jgi:chitin disaccharide deacetylase
VIFRGDDFGLSLEVNEAIEQAHTNRVLSTTSPMAGAQAATDAAARARRLPRLRAGVHVVVARGQAVLPNHEIPALTDADSRFPGNLVGRGVEYFFPQHPPSVRVEIYAQCEAFRKTGLTLGRVNAHNHIAFAFYRVGLDSEYRFGVRFTRHARTL